MARFQFSPKKRKRIQNRQVLEGDAIFPSSIVANGYRKEMMILIDAMKKEYEEAIKNAVKDYNGFTMDESIFEKFASLFGLLEKKYKSVFQERAEIIARKFIGNANKRSEIYVKRSLSKMAGMAISVPVLSEPIQTVLEKSIAENVDLIRTIPKAYHDRIAKTVMGSIAKGGKGTADVFKEIKAIGMVTDRHARFIARDQNSKVNANLTTQRCKDSGIAQFKWRHSNAAEVPRKLHLHYDGMIFDLDKPPVIDDRTGERGFPGQAINCRCTMIPIYEYKQ